LKPRYKYVRFVRGFYYNLIGGLYWMPAKGVYIATTKPGTFYLKPKGVPNAIQVP